MKLTGNIDNLSYATEKSAGFDIRSTVDIVLPPREAVIVPTGLYVDLDSVKDNEELQIRPKSGVAWHRLVIVLNSPGTVDGDYPEEIGVIMYNLSDDDFIIERGDKIAQGVVANFRHVENIPVKNKARTGGFGSTGVK